MKVIMIGAMTVCGRISPPVMGSVEDRKFLETMRGATDASLMGAGTLRGNDPEMRLNDGKLPEKRIRAIISKSGNIPLHGKKLFVHGPDPFIFTSEKNKEVVKKKFVGHAEIFGVEEGEGGLAIESVIQELKRHGVKSVLIEGGGKLNYSCLKQGIVDEMYITVTPYVSGDGSAISLVEGNNPLGSPFANLKLLDARSSKTGEVFLHYKVEKA